MPRFLFQTVFAFLPVCAGVFLTDFGFGNNTRYLSFPWSVFFGLGYYVSLPFFRAGRAQRIAHAFFDGMAWPIIATVGLFWLGETIWEKGGRRGRWLAFVLVVLCCFPVVTLERIERPPFDVWPTYQNIMSSVLR